MAGALVWLEQSALGEFVRTSSLWTYPIVNLLHILGIAALFGSVAVIDLRLLGVRRRIPLDAVTDTAVPVSTAGFCIAATTGPALLAANASEYIGNPFLLMKFAAIGVGLLNVLLLNRSRAWKDGRAGTPHSGDERRLAMFGGISLVAWITAITAGRLIAYW